MLFAFNGHTETGRILDPANVPFKNRILRYLPYITTAAMCLELERSFWLVFDQPNGQPVLIESEFGGWKDDKTLSVES